MFNFSGKRIEFVSTLPVELAAHLSPDVCIALSGAPDGSTVRAGLEGGFVFFSVEAPGIVEMRRQLFFLPEGVASLHNQRVRLLPGARGKSFLARSVAAQLCGIDGLTAPAAIRVGEFTSVAVSADTAQSCASHEGDADIGYWLLPRLGFDSPLVTGTAEFLSKFPKLSPKSLTALLEDADASLWWLEAGRHCNFTMRFDLAAGSRSRLALSRYTGDRK